MKVLEEDQPTLLVGYDVESSGDPSTVRRFLLQAERLHSELRAPCTLFIVGQVVENNWRELASLRKRSSLFNYEQHTYSHMLLKPVHMDDGKAVTLVRGGTLQAVEEEVSRTNRLLAQRLGVDCWGLTGPWGYYRGLADRPDILEVLEREGIRFTRTWARDERDYQPVPFDIQPFWYEPQGFPEILEFPVQGWQDVHWRDANGWDNTRAYLQMLKETVDMVAERGIVWGYGTHDWSSIRQDPEMSIMRGFLEYAKDRGLRIVDYRTFYLEAIARRREEAGPV